MAPKSAWSCPQKCISPNSLGHGLELYHQTRSIRILKCISNLARSSSQSVLLSSLAHGVVTLWSYKADSPSSTLHQTWNGIQKEFMRQSGSISRRIWWWFENMKGYPALINHTNCVDLRKLSKSASEQDLGKIECVFHIMRWCLSTPRSTPRSPKYTLPVAESVSVVLVSPYVYI